jgi:hypothetical protein
MRSKILLLGLGLGLFGCDTPADTSQILATSATTKNIGIRPHVVPGRVDPKDQAALQRWIDEATALLQSPAFEANYARASALYPRVYVSKTEDIISSARLLERLKTNDPVKTTFWWPKTYVVLKGDPAIRSKDRLGFGFEANRKAAAGPYLAGATPATKGEVELGRLHFARYTRGDAVEKSCALNTMTHEISHTLSDRANQFWMHILDTEDDASPPYGVFEASYFIGTIAQCTYLQSIGRVEETGFQSCLLTFSNPGTASRFRSRACDDFPGDKPISPSGRLSERPEP